MNVEIKIVKGLEKPYAVLYTSQLNEEIERAVSMLETTSDVITAVHNERTVVLKGDEIYLIRIENEKTVIYCRIKAM